MSSKVIVAVIALIHLSCSQNTFISPSSINGNIPVLQLGSNIQISWQSSVMVYNISFWQESEPVENAGSAEVSIYVPFNPDNPFRPLPNSFTWTVQLYNFDLGYSQKFFFWANNGRDDNFTSTYFNITSASSSSLSTSSSSTTSVAVSSTSSVFSSTVSLIESASPTAAAVQPGPAIASTTSTASTAASSSDTPQSQSLAPGIKAGVGVALGIGLPVIGLLSFLIFLQVRNRRSPLFANPLRMVPYPETLSDGPRQLPQEKYGSQLVEMSDGLPRVRQ